MKNIASIIELLAETWPNAFSVYEARRKPLALANRITRFSPNWMARSRRRN